MPCIPFKGGIVCTGRSRPRRCRDCKRRDATFECDWKKPRKKSGTCDAPICTSCALEVGPDKHLCTTHRQEYSLWLKARNRPGGSGQPALPLQ